jgi:hypothetical protein
MGTRVAMCALMRSELVLSLLLSGCALGPSLTDAAKARGATDLNCSSQRLSAYDAVGGTVVVQGCGAWTQYTCFYSGSRYAGRYAGAGNAVCFTDAPARVFRDTSVEPPSQVARKVTPGDQDAAASGIRHGNMCTGNRCD